MRRSIFAVVAVLGVALFAGALRAAEEAYKDITIADLKSAIAKKDVTLLDANGSESYRDGHIPGAIDFEADSDKLTKLLPKDKNALVVAYCGGPQCNAYRAAAKKALAMGYTNVKHLSAGISGWKQAGEKLEAEATK